MDDIKPCPFCGETDMIEPKIEQAPWRGHTVIRIKCMACCCTSGPVVLRWPVCGEDEEKGLQKAWDRWNERADNGL